MSKIKSPRVKKQMEYERDHRYLAEYPHAFRKSWPRKKVKVERAARHKAKQIVKATEDGQTLADVVRRPVRKWGGGATLREMVESKKRHRKNMEGTHKARKVARANV